MNIDKTIWNQYKIPESIDEDIYKLIGSAKKSKSNFVIRKRAGVFGILAVCIFGGYKYYDDYQTTNQYNQTIASIDTTLSDLQDIGIQG